MKTSILFAILVVCIALAWPPAARAEPKEDYTIACANAKDDLFLAEKSYTAKKKVCADVESMAEGIDRIYSTEKYLGDLVEDKALASSVREEWKPKCREFLAGKIEELKKRREAMESKIDEPRGQCPSGEIDAGIAAAYEEAKRIACLSCGETFLEGAYSLIDCQVYAPKPRTRR